MGFCGADIGGFRGGGSIFSVIKIRKKPELFTRWIQLGSLMPLFRTHTARFSPFLEPYHFSKKFVDINRKFIHRRYQLISYLQTLFWELHQTGSPIVRPVWYEYPDAQFRKEEHICSLDDQFFIGPALLAAPVLHPSARKRKVYLPKGIWYEYETGTSTQGGHSYVLSVDIDYYPLFVKGGSVIPTRQVGFNSNSTIEKPISLEIYPAEKISGKCCLDENYQEFVEVSGFFKEKTCKLRFKWDIPKKQKRNVWIRFPEMFDHVVIDGSKHLPKRVLILNENRKMYFKVFKIDSQILKMSLLKNIKIK